MATADAQRIEQELLRAQKHGRLIKERRLDLGLKRPAFVTEVARQGQDMTPDYLNKIESGARPLANADPKLREAIRAVLGYSPEKWQELTGLYTPATPDAASLSAAAKGYRIPKEEEPIPAALLEAADMFGDTPAFAGLREYRWQYWMAHAPHKERPVTPDDWLNFYVKVKDTVDPKEPHH